MSTRIKLTASGLVAAAGLFLAFAYGHPWHWLVFVALVFSWFGDALLAGFAPLVRRIGSVDPFLCGMGAFALAQLTYAIAFGRSLFDVPLLHMGIPGYPLGIQILPWALPVYILAGVFFWVWTAFRSDKPGVMKYAVLAYCVLLTSMGALAFSAAFTGYSFAWPLPLGGVLFILSDGVIAQRIFRGKFPSDRQYEGLVWGTYLPAQILLMIGVTWLN